MLATTPPPVTGAPPARRPARRRRSAGWSRRIPLLPALLFTIVVTQLPFVVTLVISTYSWNILHPGDRHFTWLSNYATVFTDERLRTAVLNTIVLTVSVVVISVLIGTGLALLLDRHFLGRGVVRTLLIAPFLVMPMASALLWKHVIYNPTYGLINGFSTRLREDHLAHIVWAWQRPGMGRQNTVGAVDHRSPLRRLAVFGENLTGEVQRPANQNPP